MGQEESFLEPNSSKTDGDTTVRPTVVVFLGQTGAGKSSLINLLVGSDVAYTNNGQCSVTKDVELHNYFYEPRKSNFTFVDTIGVSDSELRENEYTRIARKVEGLRKVHYFVFCVEIGWRLRKRRAVEELIQMYKLNQRRGRVLIAFTKSDRFSERYRNEFLQFIRKDKTMRKIIHPSGKNVHFTGCREEEESGDIPVDCILVETMKVKRKLILNFLSEKIEGVSPTGINY